MWSTREFVKYVRWRLSRNKNFLGIFVGETGCQPKGSKVLMADGSWKNIEKVKVGDEVLSPQEDGSHIYAKVTELFSFFSQKNYTIIRNNQTEKKLYSCSHNHIIPYYYRFIPRVNGKRLSKNAEWVLRQKEASNFAKIASYQKKHRYIGFSSFPIESFKGREDPSIDPYSLGIFLGDGCYLSYKSKKRSYTTLTITTADQVVIEHIKKFYSVINTQTKKDNKAISYSFSTKGIFANQLTSLGLQNKKSGMKFIPHEALLASHDFRLKLLAGLIDSDGYYQSGRGGYQYVSKSRKLIHNLRDLIYSLGGRTGNISEVRKSHDRGKTIGTYYSLNFYLGRIKVPLLVERRKRDVKTFYLAPNRVAIDAVEEKGSQVYGFQLDSPSSLYITDNWMVTHNSGKSYSALSFADMIDPEFTAENIAFTPIEFMQLIRSDRIKKGSVIVYDEVGARGMSAREWYSATNKMINVVLQLFRHKNLIVLFTVPNIGFIDKNARKLCQGLIEFDTSSVLKKRRLCRGYWKNIRAQQYSDKIFYQYHRVTDKKTGRPIKVKRVFFPLPPVWLRNQYEQRKEEFAEAIYRETMAELTGSGEKLWTAKEMQWWQQYAIGGKSMDTIASEFGWPRSTQVAIKKRFGKWLGRKIERGKEDSIEEAKATSLAVRS